MFVYWAGMYVCRAGMYVCQVCMYVWDKIMLQRRGLIPYENLTVFDVLFNFSRFVRGGTVDDPDIPNLSAREALHTYIHTSLALRNPAQGERF